MALTFEKRTLSDGFEYYGIFKDGFLRQYFRADQAELAQEAWEIVAAEGLDGYEGRKSEKVEVLGELLDES